MKGTSLDFLVCMIKKFSAINAQVARPMMRLAIYFHHQLNGLLLPGKSCMSFHVL